MSAFKATFCVIFVLTSVAAAQTPQGASTRQTAQGVDSPSPAAAVPPAEELAVENNPQALAVASVSQGFCAATDATEIWNPAGIQADEIFKTLMIVHPTVTDPAIAHHSRPWRFEHAIRNLAGGHDIGVFVFQWLSTFESTQNINGFPVAARPAIRQKVIDLWKRDQDIAPGFNTDAEWISKLDVTKAPFRLVAVVNRIDLAKISHDSAGIPIVRNAGEGRLVFQLWDKEQPQAQRARPFTVIFEYELIARSVEELKTWAQRWESLQALTHGTQFNTALAGIVRRFAVRNPELDRPNNIPLNQVRTNEIELAAPWEMREFRIGNGGLLTPNTVALTPDASFNSVQKQRTALHAFVNTLKGTVPVNDLLEFQVANGDAFVVPTFINVDSKTVNFLGGNSQTTTGVTGFLDRCGTGTPAEIPFCSQATPKRIDGITWLVDAPGDDNLPDLDVADPKRRWFSFNTCAGCHGGDGGDPRNVDQFGDNQGMARKVSRGTLFTHIDLRKAGRKPPPPALQDVPDVPDTVLSEFLCKNDLPLRRRGLEQMLTMTTAQIASAAGGAVATTSATPQSCKIPYPKNSYSESWMSCFFRERQQRVH